MSSTARLTFLDVAYLAKRLTALSATSRERHFTLVRDVDVTGTSGTGVVALGVSFSDGTCVMRWCAEGKPTSECVYDSVEDIELIHGHGGASRVVFEP